MAMSGIKLDPEVSTLFSAIKMKNIRHKFAFFMISEDKTKVIIDHDNLGKEVVTQSKEEDIKEWEGMKSRLHKDHPRFVLYDFSFRNDSGQLVQKLAFFFWSHDGSGDMKKKMIYASTKETVKKHFDGVQCNFEANDYDELIYDEISKKVEQK